MQKKPLPTFEELKNKKNLSPTENVLFSCALGADKIKFSEDKKHEGFEEKMKEYLGKLQYEMIKKRITKEGQNG